MLKFQSSRLLLPRLEPRWHARWRPTHAERTLIRPYARPKSTLRQVPASPTAQRQVPTPLLFVACPHLDSFGSRDGSSRTAVDVYRTWTQRLSQHGYHSLLVDVDPDDPQPATTSDEALERLSSELTRLLRDGEVGGGEPRVVSPFPPVLVARGPTALLAETYVSSNPLTALVLLDPPTRLCRLTLGQAAGGERSALPTPLSDDHFDYEVRFPAVVAWTRPPPDGGDALAEEDGHPLHRIEEEAILDGEQEQGERKVWDVDQEQGAVACLEWLEEEAGVADDATELSGTSDSDTDASTSDDQFEGRAPTPDALPEWFVRGDYELSASRSVKRPMARLDESHLEESFVRGRGPGGQAINKTSSAVWIVHLPTSTRVFCQRHRSREQNRREARRILGVRLEALVRGEGSVREEAIERERRRKRSKERKGKRRKEERKRGEAKEEEEEGQDEDDGAR